MKKSILAKTMTNKLNQIVEGYARWYNQTAGTKEDLLKRKETLLSLIDRAKLDVEESYRTKRGQEVAEIDSILQTIALDKTYQRLDMSFLGHHQTGEQSLLFPAYAIFPIAGKGASRCFIRVRHYRDNIAVFPKRQCKIEASSDLLLSHSEPVVALMEKYSERIPWGKVESVLEYSAEFPDYLSNSIRDKIHQVAGVEEFALENMFLVNQVTSWAVTSTKGDFGVADMYLDSLLIGRQDDAYWLLWSKAENC